MMSSHELLNQDRYHRVGLSLEYRIHTRLGLGGRGGKHFENVSLLLFDACGV